MCYTDPSIRALRGVRSMALVKYPNSCERRGFLCSASMIADRLHIPGDFTAPAVTRTRYSSRVPYGTGSAERDTGRAAGGQPSAYTTRPARRSSQRHVRRQCPDRCRLVSDTHPAIPPTALSILRAVAALPGSARDTQPRTRSGNTGDTPAGGCQPATAVSTSAAFPRVTATPPSDRETGHVPNLRVGKSPGLGDTGGRRARQPRLMCYDPARSPPFMGW